MSVKTEQEIQEKLDSVNTDGPTKFRAMTYEQGVSEALQWVLGQIEDEEFAP